jgi:NAD+ synthetase
MRLALATINPRVGDIEGNAELIARAIAKARGAMADIVLLPELAVCGYPPRDLLSREGFIDRCERAARALGGRETSGITAVFGVPVRKRGVAGAAANALVAYRDGAELACYEKRLLPTYDVFDEDRYFEPGAIPCVIDVPARGGVGVRMGLSICEDLWKGMDAGFSGRYAGAGDPVEELVRGGATLILSASASPFVLGKGQRHRDILAGHARRHGVHVASVNQLGGDDDLIFDGHRMVFAPGGACVADGALFRDDQLLVDMPVRGGVGLVEPRAEDEAELFAALVLGVRDYLGKTGFREALIGLSGGIDSALTCVLAAAALGGERVTGVAMPGPYSSSHSVEDALDLARRVGVRCLTVPIGEAFAGHAAAANAAFAEMGVAALGSRLPDLAEENLQSRVRGTVLMTLSNRTGAMVLTTGNKSEMAVGYATLYGDMNGGLAVLSDVSKQWVYRLSNWINARWKGLAGLAHCGREPIPRRTIEKAPSAELRPDQKDQDTLPAYEVLDEIIERYVGGRQGAESIARETGFDAALVKKVARMIDVAEFKRRQAAVGLKVTSVAFGPGRRYPIARGW